MLYLTPPPPSDHPPLVLLHGFTGSPAAWQPLLPELEKRYRVFRPWLPGHHPEDHDCPTFDETSAMLADLLASVPAPRTLLGYSLGGRLALHTTLRYPTLVDALVLESATAGINSPADRAARKDADDVLAEKIRQNGLAWFVDHWENIPLFETHKRLSPEVQEGQRRERYGHNTQGLARSLEQMGAGVMAPMWKMLSALTCPVLLVTGANDERYTTVAALMKQRIANARHVTIAGAGHTPHLEKPDAFVRAVLN